MRRLAILGALVWAALMSGCASTGLDYDFHPRPYTIRVHNDFGYGVVLYWVVAGVRQNAAAARMSPWSEEVVGVPVVYYNQSRLGVFVCVGTYTPNTQCTLLAGEFVPRNGAIVTIGGGSRLAGFVN